MTWHSWHNISVYKIGRRPGPWCAWWRGGGQSVVISVTAARALCSSTMFLRAAQAATRAWVARLLTARGRPRAASWISATASSLNSGSERPRSEVVGDVPAGLVGCQGGHGVAQGDPLVQGGQHAEAEHPAQGGLAEEQAGQRAGRVHLGVRQDPDGLELVVGQEISLVEDQQRDTAALVMLGGEQPAAWAARVAVPWAGRPPSAVTTRWWMPRVPVVGSAR